MICPGTMWPVRNMINCMLLMISCVFPLQTLRAQDIPLHFSRLGIEQGLPQNTAHCILQDSKGFIWIGTDNGLCRYSDDEIKIFRYDNTTNNSISSNYVQALAEDDRGNILVGTENGLNIYDTRKEAFRLADAGEPVSDVTCVYKDSKGNIWASASRRLFRYMPATEQLKNVALPGQELSTIRSMAEDNEGMLWMGAGARIIRINTATWQVLPLPAAVTTNPYYGKSPIHAITYHQGELWIGTQSSGVLMLDIARQQCFNYRAGADSNSITNEMVKAIKYIKGKYWVGTRKGLYIFRDRKVIAHYTNDKFDPATLSHNSVCALMEDKAGTVWIGTYWGGISQVHPGSSNLRFISGLMKGGVGTNSRTIMGIQEDKAHHLWLATGAGLNFYNRATNTFRYYHIPGAEERTSKDIIKSLLFRDDNNLWVGSLDGLYLFNIPSATFTRVPLSKEHPGWIYAVYALEKGADGWWAGTHNGLFKLDANGVTRQFRHNDKVPGSLIRGEINCLHEDRKGNLWVGTQEGLCYLPYNGRYFQPVNHAAVYAFNRSRNVHCVTEDSRGIVWAGTHDNGLLYVDKGSNSLRSPEPEATPAEKIIHGIVEDNKGNLWLSGQNNIARIHIISGRQAGEPGKITVTQYAGAAWQGINEYLNPAFKTDAGEIMFGGINGIVGFNPTGIILNELSPKVVLTGMLIKNIPVSTGGKHSPLQESITYTNKITLQHHQAYFTLHFAALNYINPGSNKFAYMMEGLHSDNKWHYVGHQTAATFTNLDPGDYTFRVKATNNDGVWSDAATNLAIRVLPPIWRTWYAYLFYAGIAIALLWWYYYYSTRTILLKNEIMKQQLFREKDRELAQNKLDFFTNISHDIKTPLTLIMAPVEKLLQTTTAEKEVQRQLQLIQQNGERLMRLMDQLLDFRLLEEGGVPLHAEPADMVHFCREITGAFEGLASRRDITLRFVPAAGTLVVWFDKDKFEKILFNLLSNALKFTLTGGLVTVSVQMEDADTLLLEVTDNGIGIPATHLEEIFGQFRHYDFNNLQAGGTGIGLALVKGLVTRHYGTIAVNSRQASEDMEGYTCFSIRIPAGNTHLKPAEISTINTSNFLVPTALPDFSSGVPGDEQEKPLLLIVEDNEAVQQYLAEVFGERYTLQLAADGVLGLQLATRHLPDIIISDVMMPGMNGVELCHALKNDSRTSHIPVILLSARSTVSFIREGYETGADDYITKPFSISLLTSRVKNLLDSRKLLRERYSRNFTLASDNAAITGPDDIFLQAVIAFIEENIAEPSLNVAELAAAVNMSRVTLYRKLKALTNQTIVEFIRIIRLKKAARLLATQQYHVNEVAYMTGFSDADYFRKWFKKEFGKTPTEFVKENNLTD
jgi:signal transduction histidine kinase/ligand-binding sensor domain-containing protein/DNA-binding response OmpR family regulator